jgi:hypothetical protein
MQQIDPNFDEKNAGFNRFSKFVSEAGHKGLIKVTRLENGQFEIAPGDGAPAVATPEPRHRERPAETAAPAATAEPRAEREEGRRGRRGRGRGRERGERTEMPEAPRAAARSDLGLTLARAFNLLREALAQLETPVAHEALRLRMAALHGRDDALLTEERFPRLLRQAHDAEIADVNQVGEGAWEVSLHPTEDPRARAGLPPAPQPTSEFTVATTPEGGTAEPAPAAGSAPGSSGFGVRFRRGPRPGRPAEVPLVGVVHLDDLMPTASAPQADVAPADVPAAEAPADATETKPKRPRSRAKKAAAEPAEAPAPEAPKRKPRAKSTKAAKKAE